MCHSTYVVSMHRYRSAGDQADRQTEHNDTSIKVKTALHSWSEHTNHNG